MQRRLHPVHRRVLGNFLTPEGRAGAERASAAVTDTDAQLVAELNDEEVAVPDLAGCRIVDQRCR